MAGQLSWQTAAIRGILWYENKLEKFGRVRWGLFQRTECAFLLLHSTVSQCQIDTELLVCVTLLAQGAVNGRGQHARMCAQPAQLCNVKTKTQTRRCHQRDDLQKPLMQTIGAIQGPRTSTIPL